MGFLSNRSLITLVFFTCFLSFTATPSPLPFPPPGTPLGKEGPTALARAKDALLQGEVADAVPLLEQAAEGSDLEKGAARQALVRLRGDEVNKAIVAAMSEGKPGAKVELLGVLAARNAQEALPAVMESVADADASVRLAALGALRYLADESNTAGIVGLIQGAKDDAERKKAELLRRSRT